MNESRVLITGGAGFIGSHLTDELVTRGWRVRILDSLIPQVHGPSPTRPDYLHKEAELLVGDVRDAAIVRRALDGVDAVVHFAAAVGVGQSMYEIEHYMSVNAVGTSVLLEQLSRRPVSRFVVASSMSIYGEGRYRTQHGAVHDTVTRSLEQLQAHRWEPSDESGTLLPEATPEEKPANLASIYALSKYDQEQMCLMIGRSYQFPTVALRFFNVYGTRQALSNPYTGVLAIFASRLLNNRPPLIFEDGLQRRDFVNVGDVARACRLALETPSVSDTVLNIGSGRAFTVLEVATTLARILEREEIRPKINGQYRVGDIRHCFADIRRAQRQLNFQPQVSFEDGLREMAHWLKTQIPHDGVDSAHAELSKRGLTL